MKPYSLLKLGGGMLTGQATLYTEFENLVVNTDGGVVWFLYNILKLNQSTKENGFSLQEAFQPLIETLDILPPYPSEKFPNHPFIYDTIRNKENMNPLLDAVDWNYCAINCIDPVKLCNTIYDYGYEKLFTEPGLDVPIVLTKSGMALKTLLKDSNMKEVTIHFKRRTINDRTVICELLEIGHKIKQSYNPLEEDLKTTQCENIWLTDVNDLDYLKVPHKNPVSVCILGSSFNVTDNPRPDETHADKVILVDGSILEELKMKYNVTVSIMHV